MPVYVVVDKRRMGLSPSPSTSLSKLLDDALAKAKVPPARRASYGLTLQGKQLDLSLSLRQSPIRAGSTLEAVVRQGSGKVRVGLQLPSGKRMAAEADASSSLWQVLAAHEAALGVNMSQPEEKFVQPVVQFMQREVATVAELRATTVASLGAANGLLRLKVLPTDMTLAEALGSSMDVCSQDQSGKAEVASAPSAGADSVTQGKSAQPAPDDPMNVQAEVGRKSSSDEAAEVTRKEQEQERRRKVEEAAEAELAKKEAEKAAVEQKLKQLAEKRRRQQAEREAREAEMQQEERRNAASVKVAKAERNDEEEAGHSGKSEEQEAKPFVPREVVWDAEDAGESKAAIEAAAAPPDRQLEILAKPSGGNRTGREPHDASTYDLTTEDLHALQEIAKRKKQLRVRPTGSQKQAAVLEAHPTVPLVVRLPDGRAVRARFHLLEDVAAVCTLVSGLLLPTAPAFSLVLPPKTVLGERQTLYELAMYPAAVVALRWATAVEGEVLTPTAVAMVKEHRVSPPRQAARPSGAAVPSAAAGQRLGGQEEAKKAKKVPKWMKLAK